jgi:hypothetical protein
MRLFALTVVCGAVVMAGALITQSRAGDEVTGWLATAAVAMALAAVCLAGGRWAGVRSARGPSVPRPLLLRASIGILVASVAATASLITQAIVGGSAAGWSAFAGVILLAVASVIARAFYGGWL